MATVNCWVGDIWLGGGLTWDYYFHPTDDRFNDVWVAPAVGTGPRGTNSPGNVEILRTWAVSTGQEHQLWFTVRNNSPDPVWFAWNVVDIWP
jgi:hypothetical protein